MPFKPVLLLEAGWSVRLFELLVTGPATVTHGGQGGGDEFTGVGDERIAHGVPIGTLGGVLFDRKPSECAAPTFKSLILQERGKHEEKHGSREKEEEHDRINRLKQIA